MLNMGQICISWFCRATAVLGILACSLPAAAMTTATVEKTCPYDGTKFSANLQSSGTSFGATLDLQPVGAIISPWPMAICPTNGFVFFKAEFDADELAKLRPFVLSDEYQAMRSESPYFRAAWLLERLGASHWEVTWALVQATWEQRSYANKVVERLPQDILDSADEKENDRRLLYGEFLRQLGQFDKAQQAFAKVLEKVGLFSDRGLLARYEMALVKAVDTSRHMQSDASKMFENDPDYQRASRIPVLSTRSRLRQSAVSEPDGLDFPEVMLKRLVWSDSADALFANTKEGIVAIDPASGVVLPSPVLGCHGCYRTAPEILLAAGGSVFVLAITADGGRSLKPLAAKTLAVTAAKDYRDLLAPALLSYDKKSIIYDVGSGVEWWDLQTDKTRSLGQPADLVRGGGLNYWYLKASDPSGSRLALISGTLYGKQALIIWDYSTNTKVQELSANSWEKFVGEIAFSADGARFYVASDINARDDQGQKAQCALSLRDSASGKLLARRTMAGGEARLSVSVDGKYVAMACGQAVSLWSADLERSIATMSLQGKGWFPSIAFSSVANRFAVHTGEAIVIYTIGE